MVHLHLEGPEGTFQGLGKVRFSEQFIKFRDEFGPVASDRGLKGSGLAIRLGCHQSKVDLGEEGRSVGNMLTVAPKLVWFVIEDHDAGCNERPEFAGILTRKFVRLGHIRVSITLRRVWLLENIIGVRSTPWVSKVTGGGIWWARRARWIVWPASRQAGRSGGKVWGPTRRSRWWAAWWTRRLTILRVRWLIISIWGGRRWPWRRLVDWVGMKILAKIKYRGRLLGSDRGFPVEGSTP